MARRIAVAVALVCVVSLLPGAQGCTSDDSVTTTCTDANVQLIQASSYDQSCKVDSDCVGVAEGNACFPCVIQCQSGGAINRTALASYQSDLSKTIGAREATSVPPCGCPATFAPCCRGGTCHADLECQNVGPEGDAAADACAPSGCTGSCLNLAAHNVSHPVDGCLVWQCCVPNDASVDAETDSGPLDASGE
jgi:hypothetical protein